MRRNESSLRTATYCPLQKGTRKQSHRNGDFGRAISHILPGLGKCNKDHHPHPWEGGEAQIQKGQGKKREKNGRGECSEGPAAGLGKELEIPGAPSLGDPRHPSELFGIRAPSCVLWFLLDSSLGMWGLELSARTSIKSPTVIFSHFPHSFFLFIYNLYAQHGA